MNDMLELVTIGGPVPGKTIRIPADHGIRTIDFPYHSTTNGENFIVHYDVTVDGLVWRDWTRAKRQHALAELARNNQESNT